MRIATFILAVVDGLVWGGFVVLGGIYAMAIANQHNAYIRHAGPVALWLIVPIAVFILVTSRLVWPSREKKATLVLSLLSSALLFAPLYLRVILAAA